MRLPFASLCLLGALAISNGALAQGTGVVTSDATEEARAAFERGTAAYEAGAFEEALVAFQRAHELTAAPEILYNIATVADRLRRDALALEAYEGYLRDVPAAPDRANVEARIAAIRAALAAAAPPPDTEPEPVDAVGLADTVEPVRPPARDVPARRPPSDDGGITLAVTGGVLALAGGVLLVVSAVEQDAASRAETWRELSGPYERVPLESGIGVLSLGLGVGLVAVGVGWLVVNGAQRAETSVALGPGSITVRGTF